MAVISVTNLVGLAPLLLSGERFPLLPLGISQRHKRRGGVLVPAPSRLDERVEVQNDRVLELTGLSQGCVQITCIGFPSTSPGL